MASPGMWGGLDVWGGARFQWGGLGPLSEPSGVEMQAPNLGNSIWEKVLVLSGITKDAFKPEQVKLWRWEFRG